MVPLTSAMLTPMDQTITKMVKNMNSFIQVERQV